MFGVKGFWCKRCLCRRCLAQKVPGGVVQQVCGVKRVCVCGVKAVWCKTRLVYRVFGVKGCCCKRFLV